MDIWSWMHSLPQPDSWPEADPYLVLELAAASNSATATSPSNSIFLKAERTSGSNTETLVTFSICLQGFFHPSDTVKTLWISNPCSLSASAAAPFLSLLLQLLQDIVTLVPTAHDSRVRPPQLKLDSVPMARTLGSCPPDELASFFNLVFLCRLFWLCVYDAPAEAGALYFQSLIPCIGTCLARDRGTAGLLTEAIGADGELLFMRTLGYILAKWHILSEVGGVPSSPPAINGFCSARESHGFWIMKGYVPVSSMSRTVFNGRHDLYGRLLEAKESVLRYALAHQQLEAVIQLEYSVRVHERFVQVGARLDNLRIQVRRLGLRGWAEDQEGEYAGERHFPSRVRLTVGPGAGSACVAGLTLGRSTANPEQEVTTQRVVKGGFGDSKFPKVKATARTGSTARMRSWRWDQDAEGNTAVFEGVLCDSSGVEVATWQPGNDTKVDPMKSGFRKRYSGANRAFTKTGGLVFAGDEYGEEVSWRLGKDDLMTMAAHGSDLKWRLGAKLWLSYRPNEVKTSYFETRCVEWCDEVDLPFQARQP